MTVKKEELDFEVNWKLKGTRNDHIHALIVYFDIWFTAGQRPIHFTTGLLCIYFIKII
jgi:type I protein arginine methyltransferase